MLFTKLHLQDLPEGLNFFSTYVELAVCRLLNYVYDMTVSVDQNGHLTTVVISALFKNKWKQTRCAVTADCWIHTHMWYIYTHMWYISCSHLQAQVPLFCEIGEIGYMIFIFTTHECVLVMYLVASVCLCVDCLFCSGSNFWTPSHTDFIFYVQLHLRNIHCKTI